MKSVLEKDWAQKCHEKTEKLHCEAMLSGYSFLTNCLVAARDQLAVCEQVR
jgi:hypothetical protein